MNYTLPPRARGHRSELRAGHPDVAGLRLALSDWSEELRVLEGD